MLIYDGRVKSPIKLYKVVHFAQINAKTYSLSFTRSGTKLENTSPSTDVFKYFAYEWYKMYNRKMVQGILTLTSYIFFYVIIFIEFFKAIVREDKYKR